MSGLGSSKFKRVTPRSFSLIGTLFCATLALPPGVSSAQDASLIPPEGQMGTAAPAVPPPISLFPGQNAGSSQATDLIDTVPEGGIAVRPLNEVSTDSLGVLDTFTGGLPVDLWSGTSAELIEILMPRIPARMLSFTLRDLTERLLLSVARPPESRPQEDVFVDMTAIVPSAIGFSANDTAIVDSDPIAMEEEPPANLGILERRVATLAALGNWDAVKALLELVPSNAMTETLAIVRSDLDLIEGNLDVACTEAQAQLSMSVDPYWQKVFAFCQLRDGNSAGAYLTMDLLRESGTDESVFFWVAELMAGNRPITPNGLERLTVLQLAMLRSAGRPFPDQLVRAGDPTLLRMLAEAPPLFVVGEDDPEEVRIERLRRALDARLAAAERAVALGSLEPEILRQLYRAEGTYEELIPAEEADAVESVVAQAETPEPLLEEDILDLSNLPVSTPVERAEVFKLAEAQTIPIARAEVISRAIDFARNDRGRNGPTVPTMGAIYGPLIETLTPSSDLVWFAGNAARALIGSGRIESGQSWLDLSEQYARTSIEAADVAAAMWPVKRQLQPTMMNRFTPLRFTRWEESRSPGRLAGDTVLILSTMSALGETVTASDWFSVMDRRTQVSTSIPAPHIWQGLALAAENGRTGEAIVLALLAMDGTGPAGVSPVVLAKVIESLRTVGLEEDARRLAVEAALVQGL